jgi:hypothetical protein
MPKGFFMRRFRNWILIPALIVAAIWFGLTIWVEKEGPARKWELVAVNIEGAAVVVFDPDPIYNLDEQVCKSFATALTKNGWQVTIATVAAARSIDASYDLYVLCANTYNWAPDRSIVEYIKSTLPNNKPVVAITLGAGSTKQSQRKLEELIRRKGSRLIASGSYWLWRPNAEEKTKRSNVEVAVEGVYNWADSITRSLQAATRRFARNQIHYHLR